MDLQTSIAVLHLPLLHLPLHLFHSAAFSELKHQFISSLILTHPEQSLQFVVEMDAPYTRLGAILSQRSPIDKKPHPYAFSSHKT